MVTWCGIHLDVEDSSLKLFRSNVIASAMTSSVGPLNGEGLAAFFSAHEITILGFGSLLSETSARGTFPELRNFREVVVHGYKRTFQHPAFIFFDRGIADRSTECMSSLSAHPDPNGRFTLVAFEVEPVSKEEWIKREEEFVYHACHYTDIDGLERVGIMCCSSPDDEVYITRWGKEHYESKLQTYDLPGIWGLSINKNIKPCSVYLRHCVLAAQKRSIECYNSFLDETYLADLTTTIRKYLEANPWVMETVPPESLFGRYNG